MAIPMTRTSAVIHCVVRTAASHNQPGLATARHENSRKWSFKSNSYKVKNNCPGLQNPKKLYTSEEAKMELIDAIDSTLDDYLTQNLQQSEYIGLILDESTDITVHKKLNVYVKCLSCDNMPKVQFLDCINVENGKADTIVTAVNELFTKKNIPLDKVVTLASDGASVMTGRKGGVGVKLKELAPLLIQIHCVVHRLALAAGQACRDVPMLDEYQTTVKSVYKHFSLSAVRYNKLRTLMSVLEDDNHKFVTLKEPASFRWLSLGKAVDAIYEVYPVLYQALEHEAAEGNAEAKGLLNKLRSVNFVLVTGFLKDVLTVISRLSTLLQGDSVDIEVVNTQVELTQAKLSKMKRVNGPELDKTYKNIENGMYRGVKLTDRETLRIGFQNSAGTYLGKLCENLTDRFEPESMATLKQLDTVLNPHKVPKAVTALESYGENELEKLIEVYGESVINGNRARDNYLDLKIILKNLNKNLQEGCVHIIKNYSELYPDFAKLAKILLVSPVTSVACERGFSVHNHIKTKGRSRLAHETVVKLMRIKQEGPSVKDFDPTASVTKFCAMRNRRK
ncbi:zinc finger protein 862-like [Mercenaria mercenaria]|uniref:zinc finger protein 862-like n=1 Tax=Mercenaria mercenaria TaxID=6596 RepID=UPI00234E3D3C|nr:zinc finger protein 862-like [Mercenaria mercenaria]